MSVDPSVHQVYVICDFIFPQHKATGVRVADCPAAGGIRACLAHADPFRAAESGIQPEAGSGSSVYQSRRDRVEMALTLCSIQRSRNGIIGARKNEPHWVETRGGLGCAGEFS